MSGHSKWATIRHKKAAVDAKRGKIFTRLLREIMIASRMGGSDVDSNPRLRTAVQAAKDQNMPKDNIERAIKKGAGELEGMSYEDILVEGYGPGGVAILASGSTDNRNRTTPEIRLIFGKNGGNMAEPGAVSWVFKRQGIIYIDAEGQSEDVVMEAALEAGAEDFANEGDYFKITTSPDSCHSVREGIEAKGITVESSSVENVPSNTVKVEGKDAEKVLKLISMLEDHDDMTEVASNHDIDPAVVEAFENA